MKNEKESESRISYFVVGVGAGPGYRARGEVGGGLGAIILISDIFFTLIHLL